MSKELEHSSKSYNKSLVKNYTKAKSSDLYDDYVIQDRPSLYSVESVDQTNRFTAARSASLGVDKETMKEKLRMEILHLEDWLAMQSKSRSNGAISVANTIRALIATRKSLLDKLGN